MTRAEKRKIKESTDLTVESLKIIHHYFPDFMESLRKIRDFRHPSYITYPAELLLIMRIFAGMAAFRSMREMTTEFNDSQVISNLNYLLNGSTSTLEELPHWETINDFLCRVNPADIQNMIYDLIRRLIRMRSFENGRIRDKYWQILVDATHLYSFSEKHCDHCLTRVYNKGTPDERTEYYHYVLEAKLYICPDLVLTIDTEFVENEPDNSSKQDCELNAFKRLMPRLKQVFKRLPICLTLDSLYACEPVFALCRQYNWRYLIRFKEGSIPTIAEEFSTLKGLEPSQRLTATTDNKKQLYSFVTNIAYQESQVNILELIETEGLKDGIEERRVFVFATDFPITVKNVAPLMQRCRARWRIENEGFNSQKNQEYYLTHLFSKNPIGMKNHYRLIQIAHMLVQLVLFGLCIVKKAYDTIHHFRKKLFQSFQARPVTIDIREQLEKVFYISTYLP